MLVVLAQNPGLHPGAHPEAGHPPEVLPVLVPELDVVGDCDGRGVDATPSPADAAETAGVQKT